MHSADGAIFINRERTYIHKKVVKEYYILFAYRSIRASLFEEKQSPTEKPERS